MKNGNMCRKKLNPRYLGLNPLVSVNELLLFRPHRGDQTNSGEYIREKTQSNKGSPVKADKHNMNWKLKPEKFKVELNTH